MLFPVLGALFVALAAYTWSIDAGNAGFAKTILALAAVIVVLGVLTIVRYLGYGISASIGDQAIVVNGREYRFDRIDSVSFFDDPRPQAYASRVTSRTWRTLTVRADGTSKTYKWIGDDRDPVAGVVDLLLGRMAEEARRRTIHGKGWSLELSTLRTANGDATPLSALSGAGIFDREVRLWRRGENEPFFAAGEGSPNAKVLLRMWDGFSTRPAVVQPRADGLENPSHISDLGRFLFTRKPSGFVNTLAALAWTAMGVGLALLVADRWAPEFRQPLVIAAAVIGAFYVLRALHSFTVRYRFYERGLIAGSLFGRRELRYADVRRMKWGERRSYAKGLYTGTNLRAWLVPAGGRPLRIRARHFRVPDDDLDSVRDIIAAHIADDLQRRLQSEGRLKWSYATLLPEGVQLKRNTLIRYDEPIGVMISDGYLIFFRDSWRRPIRVLNSADPDFFPCYALYRRLAKKVQHSA